MLRRLLPRRTNAALVLAGLVGAGVLASSCSITPVAVSVGGATVSTASINAELSSLAQTTAGACLLQVEHQGLTASDVVGAGGPGTFTMALANQVVDSRLGELLTEQYAESKGIHLSPQQLATAREDYQGILDGEIGTAAQSSANSGFAAACSQADGQPYTGAQLLRDLPPSLVEDRVRNQALDEALLARGADLSPAAVARYYLANRSLFTEDCVSRIASSSETASQQLVDQLDAGASFSDLARADSIDATTASQGGALGCNFTESQVLQSLNIQSATPGMPIGPIQDTTTGQWLIYEVTSQVVEPLDQAAPLIRRELLFVTENENRVRAELRAFARSADVYVNPQYGSWRGFTVVPPTPPPPQYLLATSSGAAQQSGNPGQRLQLNGGGGG